MSEDKEGLSRRDFLKAGLLIGGGYAVYRGTEALAGSKWDLRKEENLRRFLGEEELFEGYHPYFEGEIKLTKGATIYEEPRTKRETSSLDTTNIGEDTFLLQIDDVGDVFSIKNPFLFLKEARKGEKGEHIVEVEGPGGQEKRVDLNQSWIIFEANKDMPEGVQRDIARSMWGVGCVSLGAGNILSFDKGGINFRKEISFGE